MNSCNCILPLTNPNACVNCANKSLGGTSKFHDNIYKQNWDIFYSKNIKPEKAQAHYLYEQLKTGLMVKMFDEFVFNEDDGKIYISYELLGKKCIKEYKKFFNEFKIIGG